MLGKVHVISIGKVKKGFVLEGCEHYVKLLRGAFDVSFTALQGSKHTRSDEASRLRIVAEESALLLERSDVAAFRVMLTEEGTSLTSQAFANALEIPLQYGKKIEFLIGGPFGLTQQAKKAGDLNLALSKMTLPHELCHLVLLEQLFRVGTILQGREYHY